jgi:hypothetical protein
MNDEDYHAVCTMLAMLGFVSIGSPQNYEGIARYSHLLADEMLKERQHRQEPEEGIVSIKKTRRTKETPSE